jgi:hypothetical protein
VGVRGDVVAGTFCAEAVAGFDASDVGVCDSIAALIRASSKRVCSVVCMSSGYLQAETRRVVPSAGWRVG